MTSPGRASREQPSRSGGLDPSVVKGGILIAVAVLLGLFLLAAGFEDDGGTVETGDDEAGPDLTVADDDETDGTTGGTAAQGATTTTAASEARPPNEVTVLVANASGVSGAAQRVSDTLKADGYVTAEPANADERGVQQTFVYYVGEDEPEAGEVARSLGIDLAARADAVAPMPDPQPTPDLRGATVLVVLGTDLAPAG